MSRIYTIAKNEIRSFFYTPVAWLLVSGFTMQISIIYLGQLNDIHAYSLRGVELSYSSLLFVWHFGVIKGLQDSLFLYVPLLTMGLISKEYSTGSIKLLTSSPIRATDIVLGKYLAAVFYISLLCVIVLIFFCFTLLIADSVHADSVLSSIFGLFLLGISFSAIGLWLSSHTKHQMVAALSTLTVLFGLTYVDILLQNTPVLRAFTHWVALASRADEMRSGLIASDTVFYFIGIIVLALIFSFIQLSNFICAKPLMRRAPKYVAAAAIVASVGVFLSQPQHIVFVDNSETKHHSLPEETTEMLSEVTGPWRIVTYVNVLDPKAHEFIPAKWNADRDRFEKYARENHHLTMEYVYYYADLSGRHRAASSLEKPAAELAREFADYHNMNFDNILAAEDLDALVDLRGEGYRSVRVIEWQDKMSVLRNYDDYTYFALGDQIDQAIKRLLEGQVVVGAIDWAAEKSILDSAPDSIHYYTANKTERSALSNYGFDFLSISAGNEIAQDVEILLIADPIIPYSSGDLEKIQEFIDSGGHALFLVDSDGAQNFDRLLDMSGLGITATSLRQENFESASEILVFSDLTQTAIAQGFRKSDSYESLGIVLETPVLLESHDTQRFSHSRLLTPRDLPLFANTSDRNFSRIQGIQDRPELGLAFLVTRGVGLEQQRIVVIGDADLFSFALIQTGFMNNRSFVKDVFAWLTNRKFPYAPEGPDQLRSRPHIQFTRGFWIVIQSVLYGVVPLVLMLIGGTVLYRRQSL